MTDTPKTVKELEADNERLARLADSTIEANAAAHGAECRADKAEADNARLEADLAAKDEALEFYADPETYLAIGFFPDPPCGEFMDDWSDTGPEYGARPGKRARQALADHPGAPLLAVVEAAQEANTNPEGDYYLGLRCGIEDRSIHDRYEAVEHGWDQAFEYINSILDDVLAALPSTIRVERDGSQ